MASNKYTFTAIKGEKHPGATVNIPVSAIDVESENPLKCSVIAEIRFVERKRNNVYIGVPGAEVAFQSSNGQFIEWAGREYRKHGVQTKTGASNSGDLGIEHSGAGVKTGGNSSFEQQHTAQNQTLVTDLLDHENLDEVENKNGSTMRFRLQPRREGRFLEGTHALLVQYLNVREIDDTGVVLTVDLQSDFEIEAQNSAGKPLGGIGGFILRHKIKKRYGGKIHASVSLRASSNDESD